MATDSSDQVRVWVGRVIGGALLVGMLAGGWQVASIRAEARRLAALDKNMRDIGLALKAHAAAAEGERFPPLSAQTGVLFFDAASIFPVFLEDPATVVSPRRPDERALLRRLGESPDAAVIEEVGAESFLYIGFMVVDGTEARAFVDAYRDAAQKEGGLPPNADLTLPAPGTGDEAITIYRLFEGVERHLFPRDRVGGANLVVETQSELPILLERPIAQGAAIRVLYMDGHRRMVPFGEFPNTPAVLDALESLRALRAATSSVPP